MILLQLDPNNILVQSGETLNVIDGMLTINISIPHDSKTLFIYTDDDVYQFDIPDNRCICVPQWLQRAIVYLWHIQDNTYYNQLVLQSLSRTRHLSPLQNKLMYDMYFYKFSILSQDEMKSCQVEKHGVLSSMFAAMKESMYVYWFDQWFDYDKYLSEI